MENLNITIVQSSLHWENADANLAMFDEKLEAVSGSDLVVLPEMFTTGFAVEREHVAEEHGGKGLQWMLKKSKEKNCVVAGSIAVKDNGKFYNRLYWVEPGGKIQHYDKRHLFRMAKEDVHFSAGEEKIICELKGWKICPLICYDLRFPVWSRNRFNSPVMPSGVGTGSGQPTNGEWEYDVLLYVANWPEVRSFPWKSLLVARAIENQCYTIGVNRVGADGNNIMHSGDSVILNPRGEMLSNLNPHEERAETITIDFEYLEKFRKQFPVGMDADQFNM
jgi:omega-amidase